MLINFINQIEIEKPLDCPFCGCETTVEIGDDHHGEYFSLGCQTKKCLGNNAIYSEPPEELRNAVKSWNTRHQN